MYPTEEQIQALKSSDGLEEFEPTKSISVSDGKCEFSFNLPVHGISLLVLSTQ
jgi:hypothetical protein